MNERTNERTNEQTNDMPPCSVSACVALAGPTGQCALHAAGYAQHDGTELRCARCRRLIPKGEWVQTVNGAIRHVKACREHPDLVREREKAAEATT